MVFGKRHAFAGWADSIAAQSNAFVDERPNDEKRNKSGFGDEGEGHKG
jgi:hypothetical protein